MSRSPKSAVPHKREPHPGPKSKHVPVPDNWQVLPFLTVQETAAIMRTSSASVYKAAKEERLRLVKVAGRTVVEVPTIIAFLGWCQTQPFVPSMRSAAARQAYDAARRNVLPA